MAKASSLLWCLCAVSVCYGWTKLEAQPQVLTRAAMEQAIAFGATHEPRPYLLRHGGREDNPVVVGAVYTPFLRVAFLSYAATQRGEKLEPADVDPAVTEPLAYIAFRWYGSFDQIDPDRAEEFAAQRPRVAMLQESIQGPAPWAEPRPMPRDGYCSGAGGVISRVLSLIPTRR